jgi:transcriptional regulator with XRE-family HTH domain
VTGPPRTAAQEARKSLGLRLREMRREAGFTTARALAARAGWHESKSSRIENGKIVPSVEDLRAWTEACGVPGQLAELVVTAQGIEEMYVEWRRAERGGLRPVQQSVLPLYDRAHRFRYYQSWVVPGLLQTADYTRAVLETVASLRSAPGDVSQAVAVRMARQGVLHQSGRRFVFLVEEWVLRTVIGSPATMAAQLDHLIPLTSLPAVSFGVIPMGAPRGDAWPTESFVIYGEEQVSVELVSAHLNVRQPHEVAEYVAAFGGFASLAVHGPRARALIEDALSALG